MQCIRSIICLLIVIIISVLFIGKSQSTPLDDYVKAADPTFNWTVIQIYREPDYVLYVLNFTSQKWFDETFSNRPVWWHYLCITVPHIIKRPNAALMLIDGGTNDNQLPNPQDNFVALTSMFAVSAGSIGVDLQDSPNEPIRFTADPSNRSREEDAAIAWTWKTFIENPNNPYVLLRMPMTKAAVRAMDAVQQFAQHIGVVTPQKFIVSGVAKRGWAAWTTAAVDNERVMAVAPIVMDFLNIHQNFHHHYRSLAGWTFALKDYYELNITRYIDHPNLLALGQIIDPYNYLERYRGMKILQLQSSGDELLLPDNEDAFWSDLQAVTGGSYLRRLANADHSCVGHEVSLFFSMRSFYLSIYDNQPLPSFKWTKTSNNTHGYIRATVDFGVGAKPVGAFGYRARTLNNQRRDFRLRIADPDQPGKSKVNPVIWLNTNIVIEEQTATTVVYSLTVANPFTGWEGFYIQVNFAGLDDTVLELTTETQIIPDTYPTSDCSGDGCYGTLV